MILLGRLVIIIYELKKMVLLEAGLAILVYELLLLAFQYKGWGIPTPTLVWVLLSLSVGFYTVIAYALVAVIRMSLPSA